MTIKSTVPRLTIAEKLALVRATIALFGKWSVTDEQALAILGGLPAPTYAAWRSEKVGGLSQEQIYRLTLLLQIHVALRVRFSDSSRAAGWMGRPNDIFAGRTPLALIADGKLATIERLLAYLAADLSPW